MPGAVVHGRVDSRRHLLERVGAAVHEEHPGPGLSQPAETRHRSPFLEKFYEDPVHYGFQTQVSFLMSRVRQQQKLRNYDLFHDYLISDYIFDKDRIFATINLKDEEMEL